MNFYSEKNVYEAAKERLHYLYDEFPNKDKCVCISGGKDSTVLLHLVKEVMDERGLKKVKVFFLDQELEAPQVVDYVRELMHLPWVEPCWVQSYFREWNSSKGEWFNVWGPGEKWAREKEDIAMKDLDFDVKQDFPKVMSSAISQIVGEDGISFGGVRIDESPSRRLGLTIGNVYKDITWGKWTRQGLLTFYPIFDWRTYDVWYYIIKNNLPYCKLYNYYFTKKPLMKARVSSFIHENSIQNIEEIKEIAPQFYEALMRRVENVNTTVQTYRSLRAYVAGLPPYFADWPEYIKYLCDHIIDDPKNAKKMWNDYQTTRNRLVGRAGNWAEGREAVDIQVGIAAAHCLLAEDTAMSKLRNVEFSLNIYLQKNESTIKKYNREGVQ